MHKIQLQVKSFWLGENVTSVSTWADLTAGIITVYTGQGCPFLSGMGLVYIQTKQKPHLNPSKTKIKWLNRRNLLLDWNENPHQPFTDNVGHLWYGVMQKKQQQQETSSEWQFCGFKSPPFPNRVSRKAKHLRRLLIMSDKNKSLRQNWTVED